MELDRRVKLRQQRALGIARIGKYLEVVALDDVIAGCAGVSGKSININITAGGLIQQRRLKRA